jgi:hypothetical protein
MIRHWQPRLLNKNCSFPIFDESTFDDRGLFGECERVDRQTGLPLVALAPTEAPHHADPSSVDDRPSPRQLVTALPPR